MPIFGKHEEKAKNNQLRNRLIQKRLEMLEEIRDRILNLQGRIRRLERIIEEKLPDKALTEDKFKQEINGSDEIVERIMSEVKALAEKKSVFDIIEDRIAEKPSVVEMKRIESITGILQRHGKLTSSDLSKHLGLSRTRCNEYFKKMEKLGLVEPILIGKEKFYRLS